MNGEWKATHPDMVRLKEQAVDAASHLGPRTVYEHIPRAANAEADKLANLAMDSRSRFELWRGSNSSAPRRRSRGSEGGDGGGNGSEGGGGPRKTRRRS